MSTITITEALAEIKTIGKRIQAKLGFIVGNLGRAEKIKDQLDKDGGSTEVLKRERQAFGDLLERIVKIRVEVQKTNQLTMVTVNGQTKTLADWLAWRKEAAPRLVELLQQLTNGIAQLKQHSRRSGARVVADGTAAGPEDFILHLSETDLAQEVENLQKTLGDLDGQLSLANATTTITVAD